MLMLCVCWMCEKGNCLNYFFNVRSNNDGIPVLTFLYWDSPLLLSGTTAAVWLNPVRVLSVVRELMHCKPEGNLNYKCGWCKWQPPTALISNCFHNRHRFPQHTSFTFPPQAINYTEEEYKNIQKYILLSICIQTPKHTIDISLLSRNTGQTSAH